MVKNKTLRFGNLSIIPKSITFSSSICSVSTRQPFITESSSSLIFDNINFENEQEPSNEIKEQYLGQIGLLSEDEQKSFFSDVLTPNGYNLIVTSKDIDLEVEDLSKIVAWGINKALHEVRN